MTHTILIPHRNRHDRLEHCLRSIARSARETNISDFEVVVVDLNSDRLPSQRRCHIRAPVDLSTDASIVFGGNRDTKEFPSRIIELTTPDKGFNKCHALNAGLDVARGSTISFVDADAIVGRKWLEGVRHLETDPALIRLCYRVWVLPEANLALLNKAGDDWERLIDVGFAKFKGSTAPPPFEAYYKPNQKYRSSWGGFPSEYGPHVFGNSQFSMRREDIGDLRFDGANFPKACYEDIDFTHQVWDKFGQRYVGRILTDPDHAMCHIHSHGEPDWRDRDTEEQQKRRYYRKWNLGTGS